MYRMAIHERQTHALHPRENLFAPVHVEQLPRLEFRRPHRFDDLCDIAKRHLPRHRNRQIALRMVEPGQRFHAEKTRICLQHIRKVDFRHEHRTVDLEILAHEGMQFPEMPDHAIFPDHGGLHAVVQPRNECRILVKADRSLYRMECRLNRKLYKKRNDQKIDNVAALMDAWVAYKVNKDAFE